MGDLLRHFPRRYVKTGELTRLADLQPGEMITVVGEIAVTQLDLPGQADRAPGYRLEIVSRPTGHA